jgi:hypothetical protein
VPLDGPAAETARGLDGVESFFPGKRMLARALKAVGSLTLLTETIAFV